MRKIIVAFGFIFLVAPGCKSSKTEKCIDESRISNGPCTFEYRPVCGCDGKTYGNKCEAERAGLLNWEEGSCEGEK